MAVELLFDSWDLYWSKIPQLAELNLFSPRMQAAFREAAKAAINPKIKETDEPYYRDEQRAELGFAFEKQVCRFVPGKPVHRAYSATSFGAAFWNPR